MKDFIEKITELEQLDSFLGVVNSPKLKELIKEYVNTESERLLKVLKESK